MVHALTNIVWKIFISVNQVPIEFFERIVETENTTASYATFSNWLYKSQNSKNTSPTFFSTHLSVAKKKANKTA